MIEGYIPFDKFVLKTPILPIDFFIELHSNKILTNDKLKEVFEISEVKMAVLAESFSFNLMVNKWFNEELDPSDAEIVKYKFIALLSRLSTNFQFPDFHTASSIGKFDIKTSIELNDVKTYNVYVSLRLDFLHRILQKLRSYEGVRKNVCYHLNTTLYQINEQFKYIYTSLLSNLRIYQLDSIDYNDTIKSIFNFINNGKKKSEIVTYIISIGFSEKDANSFIEDLVTNDIIINELEINVTGVDYFFNLIEKLKTIKYTNVFIKDLFLINEKIKEINNSNFGEINDPLNSLQNLIDNLSIEGFNNIKTSFVVNQKPLSSSINNKYIDFINKGLDFLNLVTVRDSLMYDNALNDFKNRFKERYGNSEIPLQHALDSFSGINFIEQQAFSGDYYHQLANVKTRPLRNSTQKKITLTRLDTILFKRISETNNKIVQLFKEDFEGNPELLWSKNNIDWKNFNYTFQANARIIKEGEKEKVILSLNHRSSALNGLIPFHYGNVEFHEVLSEISKFEIEKEYSENNRLIVEIAHLPSKGEAGLKRPLFFEYEIPFLSKSYSKNIINLDDLILKIEDDELKIKSKKLDVEILPRISCVHDYVYGSLPLYDFFWSMQNQGKERGIQFKLQQNLFSELIFFPRVEYDNVILSLAKWKFSIRDISFCEEEEALLIVERDHWISKFNLPRYITISYYKGDLVIDLKNITSLKMMYFFLYNSKLKTFFIKEYIMQNNDLVKRGDEKFESEILINYKMV